MGIIDNVVKSISLPIVHFRRPARPIPADLVAAYQEKRQGPNTANLCNAPFNNMYLMTSGQVSVCWLSNHPLVIDKWSPSRSLHDIWFGENFQRLRNEIRAGNLHTFCGTCEHNILHGVNPLTLVYDTETPIGNYPQAMELELSNSCNLECVMCQGMLSSSIRKNREKKPPLVSPYNEQFIDQMEEFIPHLRRLRFSGGEPTRQKIVFQIIDRIEKLHPQLPVTITTNGTTFGPPLVRMFDRINLNIGVSLDSLTKEIYEGIRLNAKFDKVFGNTLEYIRLSKERQRPMTIQMNPMRMNWHETPEYVRFCNKHELWLSYNTVQNPREYALWTLPQPELERIYRTLASESFDKEPGNPYHDANLTAFQNFVGQVRNWAGGVPEEVAW